MSAHFKIIDPDKIRRGVEPPRTKVRGSLPPKKPDTFIHGLKPVGFCRGLRYLTKGKSPRLPALDLFELSVIVAAVVILMTCDPFGIYRKLINVLRLRYPIFIKEPRLLFITSIYVGTFISKAVAIIFILFLLAAKRIDPIDNLAMTRPSSRNWVKWILPFTIFSLCIRTYYANDPSMPNLPIRLVFPESMIIGNMLIVPSVLLVAPVAEELIFRGYMYDVTRRSFGDYPAILLTSVLFAAAHIRGDFEPLYLGVIFTIGLVLGFIRYRSASIWPAVVLHFIFNFVSVAVGAVYYLILGY